MPKISIVIPLFKAEKYIGRCLDSVLCQTFQDFEVLVVNDCSPDESRRIVLEYTMRDSRIKFLENRQNRGPMSTRYVGSLAATGDYINMNAEEKGMVVSQFKKLEG